MKKVKVTKEEKKCLDSYLNDKRTFQEKLKYYLENHEHWYNDYEPLKLMGVEKFVKCLTYGYELEFDDKMRFEIHHSNGEKHIAISYNESAKQILGNSKRPIYLGIYNKYRTAQLPEPFGLTIAQTEGLIKGLQALLNQIYNARSED